MGFYSFVRVVGAEACRDNQLMEVKEGLEQQMRGR